MWFTRTACDRQISERAYYCKYYYISVLILLLYDTYTTHICVLIVLVLFEGAMVLVEVLAVLLVVHHLILEPTSAFCVSIRTFVLVNRVK